MGSKYWDSLKKFTGDLIQKISHAFDILDEYPAPVKELVSDNRVCPQIEAPTNSQVVEIENQTFNKNTLLLRVVLYWLNTSYFQPLDDENGGYNSKLSLVYADYSKRAINSLKNSLVVNNEYLVQVGFIQLSDVLSKAFDELNWDKSQLKGHTFLLEMNVRFVKVDYNARSEDERLIFEYLDGTFKVSPYLFLFSLFEKHDTKDKDATLNLEGVQERVKSINAILKHKEYCNEWNTKISQIKDSTESTKGQFTLRTLKLWMEDLLTDLGWKRLIKQANEPGANNQYIASFSKINDQKQSVQRDFYFDDLNYIFNEALNNPTNGGVLLPMVNALFKPSITNQSWYSNQHIKYCIDKKNYTAARWPSPYSPVLMQQMAINLATLSHKPVFSVNGPPGTGKTTLLKDIIAQKVYDRARLIMDFHENCFDSPVLFWTNVDRSKKPFSIHPLRKEFRKCNMLVASCNNAAVENLTRELPDLANMPKLSDLVGGSQAPFDYFSTPATALLQELKKDQSRAWGLIAVPLGKRSNVDCFMNTCLAGIDDELCVAAGTDPVGALKEAIGRFQRQIQVVETYRANLDTEIWNHLNPSSDEVQKSNPFHNDAFNREREKLFYASLAVLKQFNALPQMRENFNALKLYFTKTTDKSCCYYGHDFNDSSTLFNTHDYAPELFDCLFSLVPVVSTTFASVASMFSRVKEAGRLGCLIVDEAGQASPHMAAGALWRASQVIVVGDPKQVEPVVKTDAIVKRYCRKSLQLDKVEFLSEDFSLQTMADVTNPYGGYIGEPIPSNWVGCPLRVHRRCCEPMFSIANTTSYGGTMILGGKATVAADKVDQMVLTHSCWFDMAGIVQHNGHYVEEQGEKALELVDKWLTHWMAVDKKKRQKLFVISPFKSIVTAFKGAGKNYFKDPAKKDLFKTWSDSCVGTVHTFQGKEAEEVIILLGCDQSKVSSAKWVNANMLNVAVTRAKCRVYFIGDWNVWKQNEVFANNVVFQPEDIEGEPLVQVVIKNETNAPGQEQPLQLEVPSLVDVGEKKVTAEGPQLSQPNHDFLTPPSQGQTQVTEEKSLAEALSKPASVGDVVLNELNDCSPKSTDEKSSLVTEGPSFVNEGNVEGMVRVAEEDVTNLDSPKPTEQELPLDTEEQQYLADIGLDKYLHMCLLQLSEKEPGKLYVLDMKRQWFYLFSCDNTAIAQLDNSRTRWFDDTLHKSRIQCTLVYPLRIAEEDKAYIDTGIQEAIRFVQTYLANQHKDLSSLLFRYQFEH